MASPSPAAETTCATGRALRFRSCAMFPASAKPPIMRKDLDASGINSPEPSSTMIRTESAPIGCSPKPAGRAADWPAKTSSKSGPAPAASHTFDMFPPEHDHPQSIAAVAKMFERGGADVRFAGRVPVPGGRAAVVRAVRRGG